MEISRSDWPQSIGLIRFLVIVTIVAFQLESTAQSQQTPAQQPPVTAKEHRIASRDMQFRQLAREVESLERKGALLRKVIELSRPSVVHIEADKRAKPDEQYGSWDSSMDCYVEEAGSGVLVEIAGRCYVLTNRHVIRGAELNGIRIQLFNKRVIKPSDSWSDNSTDVAVLEIPCKDVIAAKLGNSDEVGIGDFVLAFGSPFGLNHSVTHGIISAKGRRDLILGSDKVQLQDFFQTDAAINPGNSGGPLLNLRGEVIGINTAIASNSGANEGIGFAIPIKMAMVVAQHLVEDGEMIRAYLGVELESNFTAEESIEIGIPIGGTRVNSVTQGTPASDAAIQSGDVIIRFGGVHVEDDGHLVNMVGLTEVGSDVPVDLIRDGEERTVVVTLRPRETDDQSTSQ